MNKVRNKWIRRFFPFFALLVLLPWPAAYAYDIASDANQDSIRIEVAEDAAKPSYTVFGKAVGSVPSGDLFSVDAGDHTADILVTLYLTNSPDLISHYSFMQLKIGVYVWSDGEWIKASASNGEAIPQTILSLRNGQASFLLPGYAKYKIAIDGGSYYATNASGGDSLPPQLHLEVD
jgi:hypothetical protein